MNNHFNYVHSNRGIHLENNYIVATPKDIEKLFSRRTYILSRSTIRNQRRDR